MSENVIIGCLILFMIGLMLMFTNHIKIGSVIVIVVIVIGIAAFDLLTTYKIATSDLPDWMKFWLLK